MTGDEGYKWGDKKFIPDLIGLDNTDAKPFAELWIGAHPKAPARIKVKGTMIDFDKIIRGAAYEILGKDVSDKFSKKLPYLLKIITAQNSLSIQAHPDKKHAEAGFEKENISGIDSNAYNRSYKDTNHKPELICAITKFWVLNGFMAPMKIIDSFSLIDIPEIRKEFKIFKDKIKKSQNNDTIQKKALKDFYSILMKDAGAKDKNGKERLRIKAIISHITNYAQNRIGKILNIQGNCILKDAVARAAAAGKIDELKREIWTLKVNEQYKDDFGILAVYFLNLIQLQPGEAMYLPAGELHAYLGKLNPASPYEGAAVELMANSDNVLRGGLTNKYIDVCELLNILTFTSAEPKIIFPLPAACAERIYKTPADEFELSIIELTGNQVFTSDIKHSADIFIVMKGFAEVTDARNNMLEIKKGGAFMVPAISGKYTIRSLDADSVLYKASVPISLSVC
ncbi:MAG: mannose-6-phosphate isomerase, class I [bacterium]